MFLENDISGSGSRGWIEVVAGSMFSGKTEELIRRLNRAKIAKQKVEIFKPKVDTRYSVDEVVSHNSNAIRSTPVETAANILLLTSDVDVIGIDEAQFLTSKQVWQLARTADAYKLPIMCYGLRTDFQGELFPGSATLLAIADDVREIRTLCWCGKKATMNLHIDGNGGAITHGEQVEIGGNDRDVSLCRKHWRAQQLNG